jgi:hypothetical protein
VVENLPGKHKALIQTPVLKKQKANGNSKTEKYKTKIFTVWN